MKKIKLIFVDGDMNTNEIEINRLQMMGLGVDLKNTKSHDKKRDLNVTITEFLNSFEDDANESKNKKI